MIYHKKQFVTWSTTHAPPNASLEQHRHLSALDSFGILAFHHFVRILSEAAVECFSEVISPLLVEVRFWSVKSGRFLGTVHCVAKRRRLLPVTVTCDCDNMTLKNTTTLHIQRKHRNGSASTFLQSWRAHSEDETQTANEGVRWATTDDKPMQHGGVRYTSLVFDTSEHA
jgi:hypothetical protein